MTSDRSTEGRRMTGEGSERDQARQWLQGLRGRPRDEHTTGDDDALTDLGLVNRVAHRRLGHRDEDETGVTDALAALTLLRHLREELAEWEPRLIAAAREHGASWIQLAPALGVASRQAAERRYLRPRPDRTG